MALPAPNTPWPPRGLKLAYDAYEANEAWYLGDTDTLTSLYGGASSEAMTATHVHDGQLHRGGVVGAAHRFFWGKPIPASQRRTRLHIPAPADLARLSSDLLYAEPPTVQLSGGTQAANDRLEALAGGPEAHAVFSQMGELKSAFGAGALVTSWDRSLADAPWFEFVAADVIVPEFRSGRVYAVTLWTAHQEGVAIYRHLVRHEPGYIVHALYRGTADSIGSRVPLEAHNATAHVPAIEGAIDHGDNIVAIPTGIKRLTASFTINLPARAWRKRGDLAYMGRSDYAGILPLFDALDEVWSSWMRAIKLARARLMVPESYLEFSGPGRAAIFDDDQEIFSAVAKLSRPDGDKLDVIQPDIPYEQHEATVYALYREILRAAGFSASSWGDYGDKVQTATEVTDRDRASERTRDKKSLYDKLAIAEQAAAALELDGVLFPGKGGGSYPLPEVVFPDVSQVDPEKNARTIASLRAASVMTIETGVREQHPDWDNQRVRQEVDGILAEKGLLVSDPTTVGTFRELPPEEED